MEKIKVCHFTSVHPWNDIRIFEKECVSLAEAGFEVHLVAPNAPAGTHKNVRVHTVDFRPKSRMDRMRKLAAKVYKKALSVDADIYHFHDPELLPYGLKLQKKGKKVIYDSHEDVPADILHKNWIKPAWLRRTVSSVYNAYEKNTAAKLSGVISVVDIITEKFNNRNRLTLKNYPDLSNFTAKNGPRENLVVYSGGLMRIRGIKEIIQCLSLTESKPRLLMYGKWESDAYRDECMALPEWSYVDFKGFVPVEETYRGMAKAKIGLTLLQAVGQNMYSLPIKSFEYMASGLASINSDFPLWQELFKDSALYVDPNDLAAIARSIDRLLNDEDLRHHLAEAGKELVLKKYNWATEKEKLFSFYNTILNIPA